MTDKNTSPRKRRITGTADSGAPKTKLKNSEKASKPKSNKLAPPPRPIKASDPAASTGVGTGTGIDAPRIAWTILSTVIRTIVQSVLRLGWLLFRATFWFGRLIWRLPDRARLVTLTGMLAAFIVACILVGRSLLEVLYPAVPPVPPPPPIAPLFTREVQFWGDRIKLWGAQYGVDPNLAATIMQIESCGLPSATSTASAQGLFQVMPFHFTDPGETTVMTNPDVNARRAFGVMKECLGYSNGEAEGALACYNGGPSQVYRTQANRYAETRRYVDWGGRIYVDAQQGKSSSEALTNWLQSGGVYLCERAAVALNLPTPTPAPPPTGR